ncbi:uncharacterized protein LOC129590219 isoform X2 [Paramacrobiotus metropolitanus]|nr:uncharacterized protein LOC129590219 isoform X2 [Paramacrobiotus metropolitanus]XP_055341306.1 uncharacterized protein LOC129590219 isoform X2 [Paramacrobiotus metropolitanus]XP_055341307.1 uncharacterized protein LOC129590219 isoform X2 [Paramacrobiotus metropolitanus]
MDKFRLHQKPALRPRQFEDDDEDDDEKSDVSGEHSNAQLTKEIRALEKEVRRLEGLKSGKGSPDDSTIHANLTFNLRWKKYRNLSDEDTMELKYEVVGKSKEAYAIQVLVYIVIPCLALILLIYTAVSLYWTKCWFWKVVPPDRYYRFERFEIDQDDEPADIAPLIRTPAEVAGTPEPRLSSPDNNYPKKEPRVRSRSRSRNRDRDRGATDEAFAMSAFDYDAKPASARSPQRDYYRGKR